MVSLISHVIQYLILSLLILHLDSEIIEVGFDDQEIVLEHPMISGVFSVKEYCTPSSSLSSELPEIYIEFVLNIWNLSSSLHFLNAQVHDETLNWFVRQSLIRSSEEENEKSTSGRGNILITPNQFSYDIYGYFEGDLLILFDLSDSISFQVQYRFSFFQFRVCEDEIDHIISISDLKVYKDSNFDSQLHLFDPNSNDRLFLDLILPTSILLLEDPLLNICILSISKTRTKWIVQDTPLTPIYPINHHHRSLDKKNSESHFQFQMSSEKWRHESFSFLLLRIQTSIYSSFTTPTKKLIDLTSNATSKKTEKIFVKGSIHFLETGVLIKKNNVFQTTVASFSMIAVNFLMFLIMCLIGPIFIVVVVVVVVAVRKLMLKRETDSMFSEIPRFC